jgi:nitroreductase
VLSTIDAIKTRRSVRTFNQEQIPEQLIEKIKNYFQIPANRSGPFGNDIRFDFLTITGGKTDRGVKIGTYGILKGVKAYIAGIVKNTPRAIIDFGFVFEKMILFLTKENLGTCWLGGTFNRDALCNSITLFEGEIVPAVTPIGYKVEKPRFAESGMRKLISADNKKPWEHSFYYKNFELPLDRETSGTLEVPFEMVRIGPSASNKQPWRLLLSEDKKRVHFYLALDPKYAGNKRIYKMQRIDIGIAIYHFESACGELGLEGSWVESEPDVTLPEPSFEFVLTYVLLDTNRYNEVMNKENQNG